MPELHLPQLDRTLHCAPGSNLYTVLATEGLIEGPCGGTGVCGKCQVTLNGAIVLACHHTLSDDAEVLLPQVSGVSDIMSQGFVKDFMPTVQEGYGIAVDIGTTTVVAALYDLSAGTELLSLSCLNGQKRFGQDVISRIRYTMEEPDGLTQLQEAIAADLRRLTAQLLRRQGLCASQVQRMVVAGNTTMIHLLAGRDPSTLASAPYHPAFTGPLTLPPTVLGLPIPAAVECLPAIASYVGGDITAGVAACGIDRSGPLTLLLDIGTNGEIVLAGNGGMHCCSCAAGPALEGMNISCGMRAAQGAIEAVALEGGRLVCQTIQDGVPLGLCGSGLLSAIAVLCAGGVIAPNGRLSNHPLVHSGEGGKRVMLDEAHGIYLSQKDIRQVQLAKGAILSGVLTLLAASGHTENEVERVIVAGQFGAHLTAQSLIGCGLLPTAWADRITYAGNTSKSGAALCLLSPEEAHRCTALAQDADYIELSTREGYETLFVACLHF